MKVLILNSGTGTRMGSLTRNKNKCLATIGADITIIDWQLKMLFRYGLQDICITTGPFAQQLKDYLYTRYPQVKFVFIHNSQYEKTNYIFSIYLARNYLNDNLLLMHGDLLFDENVLKDVLASKDSVMTIDHTKPLPEKDFKAVVVNGQIRQVGVEFFTNAYYAQPLYKLNSDDWAIWLNEIIHFCEQGKTNVYAENALNKVSNEVSLLPLDLKGQHCFEVDTLEDLEVARAWYMQVKEK